MTYMGRVKDGQVIFDEPSLLADGTRVTVEVIPDTSQVDADLTPTLRERLAPIIGKCEGMPVDCAENHDHYLREEYRR